MRQVPDQIMFSYADAAALLGLPSVQALRDLVHKRRGPRVSKLGSRVFFARVDLEEFVATLRTTSRETEVVVVDTPRRGRPCVIDRQQAACVPVGIIGSYRKKGKRSDGSIDAAKGTEMVTGRSKSAAVRRKVGPHVREGEPTDGGGTIHMDEIWLTPKA